MFILKFTVFILLIGILPLPYGFYIFLRLCVTIVSLFTAFKIVERQSNNFWILIIISILFNPIIPVFLFKIAWIPIDLFASFYFFKLSKKYS